MSSPLCRKGGARSRGAVKDSAGRLVALGPVGQVCDCAVAAHGYAAREGLVGELSLEVADHAPVDDVGEVALEDSAGFLLGVPAGARVSLDALGAWLAAQLGDRHPVQDRVDAPVAAGVVAVADRLAGPLGGRGGQRR